MKTRILTNGFLAFLFVFAVTSCEKSDNNSLESTTAEDDAYTSLIFDDIYAEVEDAMAYMEDEIYGGMKKSAEVVTCKTITVEQPNDSTFWPRTVTVDFGEGCTGLNGVVRSGKIITVVNGRYPQEGYTRTTTLDDFYVNGFKVEGVKTVVNEGANENENIFFTVSLSGGKITSPEGVERTKQYERVREWVAGSETPRVRIDDEYLITGSASGQNRKGEAYSNTIIEPLQAALSCRWIKSGTVQIVKGETEALLDYGEGECDRFATVTIGDESKVITLHR